MEGAIFMKIPMRKIWH